MLAHGQVLVSYAVWSYRRVTYPPAATMPTQHRHAPATRIQAEWP